MTNRPLDHFKSNDIISLVSEKVSYDLAESVGPDLLFSDVLDGSDYKALSHLKLEYGTAAGAPQLRQLVADRHKVDRDDVVITVGGMHAIFLTAQLLCGDDDHVVLCKPAFPLASSAFALGGARVDEVLCRFDQGYRLDLIAIKKSLQPSTRLVCLASPQNPSGVEVAAEEISDLVYEMKAVCPDAYLLVDETYREATYGESPATDSFVQLDAHVISCASLSKCHGAPGLRIGWAISQDPDVIRQLVLGKFQTVIACSGVDEALAMQVLLKGDELMTGRQQHLRAGRDCVVEWAARYQSKVDLVIPTAGALCCMRLNPQIYDRSGIETFHHSLAMQSVRVAPGHWFGDELHVFRLGFGLLPINELQQALEIIGHVLDNTDL